jgi:mannosyltransferase
MVPAGTGELRAPETPATMRSPRRAAGLAARLYWLWPALLMLACASLRLGTPSLWADELATWGAVRLDWPQLRHLLGRVDGVFAPYYFVLHAWTSLAGTSPVALRLPSVLVMAAAAALVAVLGARLVDRWAGLLAGLVFALVPATSRYAQEARPYAFSVLFAVLATLLLIRYQQRPGPRTGAWYALAIALLGAAHLLGLLLLLAHAVAARRRLATWAGWAAAGVLPLLPLIWLGYRQRAQADWIPPPGLSIVLSSPDIVFTSAEVGGVLLGLGTLSLARRPDAVLLAAWGLAPAVGLAAAGQVAPLFYARYLLFALPAWVLLAALTLGRLSRVRALALVGVVALLGAPTQQAIRTGDGHGTGSASAGRIIASNERAGDAIAYRLDDTAWWEARDVIELYVPAARRPLDVFQVTPQRSDGRTRAGECADLAACLHRANPARLWIVVKGNRADPMSYVGGQKAALLRARYHPSRLWLLHGLTVALYARN